MASQSEVEETLQSIGVGIYYVIYRTETGWQLEFFGHGKRHAERLKAAGFQNVGYENDSLEGEPYCYVRFDDYLPTQGSSNKVSAHD